MTASTGPVPTQPIAADDRRAEVERLLAGSRDDGLLPPGQPRDVPFAAPWELRVFALAVAASRNGRFTWPEFQERLVTAITQWEDGDPGERPGWSYYQQWLHGLEALLLERDLVDADTLAARTQEYLADARDPKHH